MNENWPQLLDDYIAELLGEIGCAEPPVDPFTVAAKLNLLVVFDEAQVSRGRHKRVGRRSLIFVRPDERGERLNWVVAHELGEVLAAEVFRLWGIGEDEISLQQREQFANLFAARLLLPAFCFLDDAQAWQGDLPRLKQKYQTASHELIALRLLDLDEFSIITIFDQGKLTRRRCNFGATAPRLSTTEQQCWQQVFREGQPLQLCGNGCSVQGWPIHEDGWKREVLRTIAREELAFAERDCW